MLVVLIVLLVWGSHSPCVGQKTTCGSHFSPPTTWVPGSTKVARLVWQGHLPTEASCHLGSQMSKTFFRRASWAHLPRLMPCLLSKQEEKEIVFLTVSAITWLQQHVLWHRTPIPPFSHNIQSPPTFRPLIQCGSPDPTESEGDGVINPEQTPETNTEAQIDLYWAAASFLYSLWTNGQSAWALSSQHPCR